MTTKSTICAIATATGNGAIAVIRISGNAAFEVCDKIFVSKKKNFRLTNAAPNTIHFGQIVDKEVVIDEVLVSVFCNPQSYTGENTLEISCHGSIFIQQQILQLIIKQGVRLAKPGEFTMRAFLNGKMDLSQAEAVADLIASNSKASHRVAIQQMKGGFSSEIRKLRSDLLQFISLIELELDFAEEDVEFADRKQLSSLLVKIRDIVSSLSASFDSGNALRNGVPVAIVGEPNVGKSTLLNFLLKDERAIVSEIAGTTRDSIEDMIVINGIPYRFIDTAGLRNTTDVIENLGIERTHNKIRQATIILKLVDATDSSQTIDNAIRRLKNDNPAIQEKKFILVVNKIDKISAFELEHSFFKENYSNLTSDDSFVLISAKQKQNISALIDILVAAVSISPIGENDVVVTNVRHFEALNNTSDAINRALAGITNQIPTDFLSQDIREAIYHLGEITGEITTDEILGNIFSKFCIGK